MKRWTIGWMLVVASVVIAGCHASDVDERCAQDADCRPGQQCELATGQCVVVPKEDRNPVCATSADCLSSEICHPTARVCVQTCRASADCPDTAKACDAVSATDSRKVCQCATDTLCNATRQHADLICSGLDKVCTPRCVADADCGSDGRCDTAMGQCVKRSPRCTISSDCLGSEICHPSAKVCVRSCASNSDCPDSAKRCDVLSTTDSRKVCKCSVTELCNLGRRAPDLICSTQHSVCTPPCTSNADCGTGEICDPGTRQCKTEEISEPVKTCTGEGLSTCDYGTQFCGSTQCTPLPTPECANYTNFTNKGSLGTTGAILYNARVVSAAMDTTACGTTAPKRVKIALSAYSSTGFPPNKYGLSGFFLVHPDGSLVDGSTLVFSGSDYTVSADRQSVEIVVSLCIPPSITNRSTGFYFTGGNFFCFLASY